MIDVSHTLIEKAVQKDVQAFQEIYELTGKYVYNIVLRIVNNAHDAQEVTQDVFVAIYKKLDQFNYQSKFTTWAYRIAVNSAINFAKRRTRTTGGHVSLSRQAIQYADVSSEPELTREERESTVQRLFNQLPEEQRACMVLRTVDQLSYEEIADVLGINMNTVRSRLKRAREKLMQYRKEVIGHEV
ncbi:MAG: RNA polymerase sigma factor [Candidatus Omnitrophica bacterium]|nr:RNA polymerase sigma factor [Candidatus Omnitrophota bacterium]